MSIIDFHSHVWPDDVAPRVIETIREFPVRGDGTVEGLLAHQEQAGVASSVCLSFAAKPEQVDRVNAFAGELANNRIIPFGTIHPALPIDDNLHSLRAHGIRGIKVHPTFQNYRLDDRDLWTLLEAVAGEFPVVFHVGAGAGADGSHATPQMIAEIKRAIPQLTVVAAHLGGFRMRSQAADALLGTDVYIDTSWPPSVSSLDHIELRETFRRHGIERVVFGSDWPTASAVDELAAIRRLGLTDEELSLVFAGNARRILRDSPSPQA